MAVRQSRTEKDKAEQAKAALEQEEQRGLPLDRGLHGIRCHRRGGGGHDAAFSAEIIAQETGLGDSFVRFMFGGVATTLRELSTMITAARLRQFEMTFSDAFGTNLCSTGLIFLADAFYRGGPILNEVGSFSLFGQHSRQCTWQVSL